MPRWVGGLLVAVVACLTPLPAAWAQSAEGQDPLAGAKVFEAKGCAKCHAINGVGGKVGPDLAKVARPRSFHDLATGIWNHLPGMTARMKAMGIPRERLEPREASELVAFLYTLNYFDRPGDGVAGRRLFTEKHCVSCHQVGGTGGTVGPRLDAFKPIASPISVAAAMWNHGPQMAEKMKERGIERPSFTSAELRDLIAFLAPAMSGQAGGAILVLPGRADEGRTLFAEKKCVQCHSVEGAGGSVGPALGVQVERRNPIELAAAIWNKAPKMQAALKPGMSLPQLAPLEMADIVAYLYTVGYFADRGRPTRGWQVMLDKGCLHCHSVYGERGKPASDLSRSKGLASPAGVLAGLWNHATVTAPTPGGGRAAWPRFQPSEMADLMALLQGMRRGP